MTTQNPEECKHHTKCVDLSLARATELDIRICLTAGNTAEFPAGWCDVVGTMLRQIREVDGDFTIKQIKEKFGELRVYVCDPPKEVEEIIAAACKDASMTCVDCGVGFGGPLPHISVGARVLGPMCSKCNLQRGTAQKHALVVYLAGMMTGLPEFNYPAFHEAAARLRAMGFTVINPAENFNGDLTLPRDTYLRKAYTQVCSAKAIAMMPGWEKSAGAKREHDIATDLGLMILDADTGEALDGIPKDVQTFERMVKFQVRKGQVLPLPDDDEVVSDKEIHCASEALMGEMMRDRFPIPPAAASADHTHRDKVLPPHPVIKPPAEPAAEPWPDQEARALVFGDRNSQYGSPLGDYQKTAKIWSGLLFHKLKLGVEIEPQEAVLMMAGMKMSRLMHKYKRDSEVDVFGYLLCHHWIIQDKQKGPANG